MKSFKIKSRIYLFSLILVSIVLSSCQSRPNRLISQSFPLPDEPLSAFGWVGVSFTEPMDHESVDKSFSISPPVGGEAFWQENAFWFRPIDPFVQDTVYTARLSGEVTTAEGRTASMDYTWEFTVRPPELLYFVPMDESGEIWRASADGGNPRPLTATGGAALEFAADRSGTWVAYSVLNNSGGSDLWLMDRDGADQRLLLNCGQDLCSEPAWSMDRVRIAYARVVYDTAAGGYDPAQVWTVDVASGETAQLYQSEIAFGHSPSFSTDGHKLATYDTTQNAIRVLDLQTSQESGIPRTLPGSGDWSADSSQILFTDVLAAENEPFVEIYIAYLASGDVDMAFETPSTDTDFSQPRWHPEGNWLAVALRPVNANITKALWVLPLSMGAPITVADDPSANFSAYQWDPWGKTLAFQRLVLSGSEPQISIWRWDWETREAVQIIEQGARPQWLP